MHDEALIDSFLYSGTGSTFITIATVRMVQQPGQLKVKKMKSARAEA